MKIPAILLVVFSFLGTTFAASNNEKVRTLSDIPAFPQAILRRTISPTLYQHLLASPVKGWIAVRGELSGTHIHGARVIHSELDGKYDQYALELAAKNEISGHYSIDQINPSAPVLVHVLIFKIADGTMALSFAHFSGAGGEQFEYYGSARLAVLQDDGRQWVDLKLPQGPHGKMWHVRSGLANNFALQMKLQQINSR